MPPDHIERIMVAIYGEPDPMVVTDAWRPACEDVARRVYRVVLEAIMEPTAAQIEAGNRAVNNGMARYPAMIRQLLKEAQDDDA